MPIAVNGDYFQHWYVNTDSVGIYYAQPTDPVWTFKMPAYIAPLWNRNRPAQTFQVHGPANMIDGGDEDHILVVVDGGRYYEVWNAQVDQATRTVTNRPSGPGCAWPCRLRPAPPVETQGAAQRLWNTSPRPVPHPQ